MYATLLPLAALAASTTAHTIFQEVFVNGVSQGHEVGLRLPSYDGPITDVTSNDLICNGGINPYTSVSNVVIPVPAGATVGAQWHHTLAGADPSDNQDPIDPGHKGPLMVYMAQVTNPTSLTVTGLNWFKIWEDGYTNSTGTWGVDRMIAAKGLTSFTIPSCIPAGYYLLRVELLALHAASSYPGAQFYMECAQIQVTGGGSTQPSPTVSFPGAYHPTDPGVKLSIYYPPVTNYTIPGPSVFTCGGSSPQPPSSTFLPTPTTSTVVPTTTKTTVAPTTTKSTATTSPTSSSAAPTGSSIPQYGQCGGSTYSGSTVCSVPFKCVAVSPTYYSQCQ